MRAARALVVGGVAVAGVAAAGCDGAASPDPGLGALLQIPGAQFRPGPLPAPADGPATVAVRTRHAAIAIGSAREKLDGVLGPGARAALIGVAGADGAWIVPAGAPAADTPEQPSVAATLGLADGFPAGPFSLVVLAADADGQLGPGRELAVVAAPAAPPTGALVIELAWDGPADLDLHVVDPLGGEAWAGDPNTWQPPAPGEPVDPTAYQAGGILDHDGNAGCHRDGHPGEHVIWTQPPPAGAYTVRVDARALCGAPSAAWYAAAYRDGALIGAARGVATDADAAAAHGKGAGVRALGFSL